VKAVVVVGDFDAGLTGKGAGDPADVLHDPTSARDREGQEQGIAFGEVKTFAVVGAGGQQQDPDVARPSSSRIALCSFLPVPPFNTAGSRPCHELSARSDVLANRFLKTCKIIEEILHQLARRAACYGRQPAGVRRSTLWSLPWPSQGAPCSVAT
jgi:hypothetical protein